MSPCCLCSSPIPVKFLQCSGPLGILTLSEKNEQQVFNLSMHETDIWKTETILVEEYLLLSAVTRTAPGMRR